MSVFGGLSSKFSPRYLVLLSTGELCIYSCKEDFDQRKTVEDVVSLEDVNAKKVRTPAFNSTQTSLFHANPTHALPCLQVQSKSGTGASTGPQYLELFQPFKGQVELGFSNYVAAEQWLQCIEQVQAHLKRIDGQKAELGGSEGKASASEAAEAYAFKHEY